MELNKMLWICCAVLAVVLTVFIFRNDLINKTEVSQSFVSKTEYIAGDMGQVIVELRNAKTFDPVPAICYSSVWYPDKSFFINHSLMTVGSYGTQFINFTVPVVEGVYEYQTNCSYLGKDYIQSKSFHVSGLNRVLSSKIDLIPKVNFLAEGVSETRLNKWNSNSWKIEGNGTIIGADCVITPAVFTDPEYDVSDFLISECSFVRQDNRNSAKLGVFVDGLNNMATTNFVGLVDKSQPQYFAPDISTYLLAPRDIVKFNGGGVNAYVQGSDGSGQRLAKIADMGIITAVDFTNYDVDAWDAVTCGIGGGVQPTWSDLSSGVHKKPFSLGQVYCYITDEGYIAKTLTIYNTNSAMGAHLAMWAGCEQGTFITIEDDRVGVQWYSNSTYFQYGMNYEIDCDIQYSLNNVSENITGLKQYVYVNNEGKLGAYVVK